MTRGCTFSWFCTFCFQLDISRCYTRGRIIRLDELTQAVIHLCRLCVWTNNLPLCVIQDVLQKIARLNGQFVLCLSFNIFYYYFLMEGVGQLISLEVGFYQWWRIISRKLSWSTSLMWCCLLRRICDLKVQSYPRGSNFFFFFFRNWTRFPFENRFRWVSFTVSILCSYNRRLTESQSTVFILKITRDNLGENSPQDVYQKCSHFLQHPACNVALSYLLISCLDIFHDGDQIEYSFVSTPINISKLALMGKIQKNIQAKVRPVGLEKTNTIQKMV